MLYIYIITDCPFSECYILLSQTVPLLSVHIIITDFPFIGCYMLLSQTVPLLSDAFVGAATKSSNMNDDATRPAFVWRMCRGKII